MSLPEPQTNEEKENFKHKHGEHKLWETYFHIVGEYKGSMWLSGPWIQTPQDMQEFKRVLIDWCNKCGVSKNSKVINEIVTCLWKEHLYYDFKDDNGNTILQLTVIGGTNIETWDALKNLGVDQLYHWYTVCDRLVSGGSHEITFEKDDKEEDLARKIQQVVADAGGELPYRYGPKNRPEYRRGDRKDVRRIETFMTLDEARTYLEERVEEFAQLGYECKILKRTAMKGWEVTALIWYGNVSRLFTLTEVKVTETERVWSDGLTLSRKVRDARLSRRIVQDQGWVGTIPL